MEIFVNLKNKNIFQKAPECCSKVYKNKRGISFRPDEIVLTDSKLFLNDSIEYEIYSEKSGN